MNAFAEEYGGFLVQVIMIAACVFGLSNLLGWLYSGNLVVDQEHVYTMYQDGSE